MSTRLPEAKPALPWTWGPTSLPRHAQHLAGGLVALVPALERGGAPYDYVRRIHLAPGTSGSGWEQWSQGMALDQDTSNPAGWSYPTSEWVPTDQVTVLIGKLKLDGTNRQSAGFGVHVSNDERCGAHLPWSDGTVYWDFGAGSGDGRLSVASLTFGDDFWIFTAGPRGMEIWQNAHLRGSKTAHDTRVSQDAEEFWIGNGHGESGATYWQGDNAQFGLFAMWERQFEPRGILELFRDPFAIARPSRRTVLLVPAAGETIVTPAQGALTVTGLAPTILHDQVEQPAQGALTVTGLAPTILHDQVEQPAQGALSLTGLAPTVLHDQVEQPAQGTLSLTGLAPTVLVAKVAQPGAGALTITGLAPTILHDRVAQPGVAALTATGLVPTKIHDRAITPGVAALILSGLAPTADVAGVQAATTKHVIELEGRWAPTVELEGRWAPTVTVDA